VFYLLSFLYGASIGSFVQVIATRLHVAPILKGRSKCLSCGEALRLSDLVPVFSVLYRKGKCKYCKASFGYSSLFVEVFFGLVFVALYMIILAPQVTFLASLGWLVYYSLLFGVFGVMALYDRAHTYIPISFLLTYGVLTLMMLGIRAYDIGSPAVLLGPVIVALPFLVVWLVTQGKGLGFGDVLLFLGVGAFFGVAQGYAVLLLAIWSGAIVGLYMKYLGEHKGKKYQQLAFVPYILLAFLLVLFLDIDIFSIASLFS
jgi:leader peptidase (prepilin peptidase)/N-methyltransferase